jgi:hypothetical protein
MAFQFALPLLFTRNYISRVTTLFNKVLATQGLEKADAARPSQSFE